MSQKDQTCLSASICISKFTNFIPSALFPKAKLAAVLILLFEEAGQLRVLLTTRSKDLRTHAGQTALPGGRVDESDITPIQTAASPQYREAHEEVALPLNSPLIRTLGTLRPFVSLHGLIVTPVVALLADPSIISTLKAAEAEVAGIFTHPLEAILDPALSRKEPLVSPGEDWIYDTELHNTTDSVFPFLKDSTYRMHRFRSCATPIKGLTADILIHAAEVAFGRPPEYDRWAEGQPRTFATISQCFA
ncbi:Nudix hydrolase domain-containing protein [Mycena sanguinolenta]|uniref:Nudix hydrolase domain-containing protein n=1 Tax=Mycena sanguinolenta TaxID=230812 RepID=A0A8H6XZW1_9AGAR|nr:Nudix hydrolase domain-containing protein [Mycena sanguinolenta]